MNVLYKNIKMVDFKVISSKKLISDFSNLKQISLLCNNRPTRIIDTCRIRSKRLDFSLPRSNFSTTLMRLKSKAKTRKPIVFKKKKERTEDDYVDISDKMTIKDFAAASKQPIEFVFETLASLQVTDQKLKPNTVLSKAVMSEMCKRLGKIYRKVAEEEEDNWDILRGPPPDPKNLVPRPPVVTIMGHVDHGKTTLLDQLRNTRVVDTEFGGITQHIGAFTVVLSSGESICFLDTPGHAAFSAMRSRGARLTDIVVLVVSADDGVMPQTIESINHAKKANVPIVVAINKIDKFNSDVKKTKQMLLDHNIFLEEFGGDVQAIPISALKGTNVEVLQEAIVALSEQMNLMADPQNLVEGRVVEAEIDPVRGKLATVVVQQGTLRRGDAIIAGLGWGKVRGMFDDMGNTVEEALPSTAVQVIGWKELPSAGDELLQGTSESEVKTAHAWRKKQKMKEKVEADSEIIEEKRQKHAEKYVKDRDDSRASGFINRCSVKEKEYQRPDGFPQFSFVLKGDVDGSVEAILDVLDTYHSKLCRLDIIHYGVGPVTEKDVEMASLFDGDVYAFNINTLPPAKKKARASDVSIKNFNIIYRLFEDVLSSLTERLPLLYEDDVIAEARVLQCFQVTVPKRKKAMVAGCRCNQGPITMNHQVKVVRGSETIYRGKIVELRLLKDVVDSIKTNSECGILLEEDIQFQPGDLIQCYEAREVKQEIDWRPSFQVVEPDREIVN